MDPTPDMIERAVDYVTAKREAGQVFMHTWGVEQLLRAALAGVKNTPSETEDRLNLYLATVLATAEAEAKLEQIRNLIYDQHPTSRTIEIDLILEVLRERG